MKHARRLRIGSMNARMDRADKWLNTNYSMADLLVDKRTISRLSLSTSAS